MFCSPSLRPAQTTSAGEPIEITISELVQRPLTCRCRAQSWSIVGKDLISEVTCSEPYEWKDPTGEEWEFNPKAMARAGKEPFHVSPILIALLTLTLSLTRPLIDVPWAYCGSSHDAVRLPLPWRKCPCASPCELFEAC